MTTFFKFFLLLLSSSFTLASYLQNFIGSQNVIVFSSTRCPWCDKAKDLLKSQGIEHYVVDLDALPQNQGQHVYEELVAITKQTTVPNIFIKGKHVGGYDSISNLHQKNLLKVYAQ